MYGRENKRNILKFPPEVAESKIVEICMHKTDILKLCSLCERKPVQTIQMRGDVAKHCEIKDVSGS